MEGNKPRASTMPTDALGIDWLEEGGVIVLERLLEENIMAGSENF